jgi:lipopolysaccharide export system permease protein
MLLQMFLPIFLSAMAFFVTLLEMVDLFSNLWRYLNNDAAVADIIRVAWLYLPKCIGFALPAAILFAVAYTMGTIYSRNELISILGAGIPFVRLITPLLVLGLLLSAGYFLFHEHVIIDTFERKNALTRELLGRSLSRSSSNVTAIGPQGRAVFHADFYNDQSNSLSGVVIIHRNERGEFIRRIDCSTAVYQAERQRWQLQNVTIYELQDELQVASEGAAADGGGEQGATGQEMTVETRTSYVDPRFTVPPESFRREVAEVEEMRMEEARQWIASLRSSGQPHYRAALTEFYQRFSFALTPLIVMLISSAIGSRFGKNILLMSLLTSLLISVIYYVMDMLLVLLAKQGILEPAIGAWGAVLFFFAAGLALMRTART